MRRVLNMILRLFILATVKAALGLVVLLALWMAHAYAQTVVTGASSDKVFPTYMEGLINYKSQSVNQWTQTQANAMPGYLSTAATTIGGQTVQASTGVAGGTNVSWLSTLTLSNQEPEASSATTLSQPFTLPDCLTENCFSSSSVPTVTSPGWFIPTSGGQVVAPGPNAPDMQQGQQMYTNYSGCYNGYGTTMQAIESACTQWLNTVFQGSDDFEYTLANCSTGSNGVTTCNWTGTCHPQQEQEALCTSTPEQNAETFKFEPGGTAQASCPGVSATTSLNNCSDGEEPTMPPTQYDIIDGANDLPFGEGPDALSSDILAYSADEYWSAAANESGYTGLPVQTITSSDVDAYNQTIPSGDIPDVQDGVAPLSTVETPTGGGEPVAVQPVTMPSQTSPQGSSPSTYNPQTGTSTGSPTTGTGSTGTPTTGTGSTSSNPSSGDTTTVNVDTNGTEQPTITESGSTTTNVTVNSCGLTKGTACETDWNPDGSTLPTAPTPPLITDILNPILSMSNLSFWKTWQPQTQTGACPQPSFTWQGVTYQVVWCPLFENNRGLIQAGEMFIYTMLAFYALFSA